MASLLELQRAFGAALRDPSKSAPVTPARNLGIYRNNAALNFRAALAASFPVIRKRVGDEYFTQLAHFYRERHPSRSGDLHGIGEHFAEFLDEHLADGAYAWLADLARLEWSREVASIIEEQPAIAPDALAKLAPDALEHIELGLQPSIQLHTYSYPIFSVWLVNQSENASPVDQSAGPEAGMVRSRDGGIEIRILEPALFSFLSALAAGATLGHAMSLAELDEKGLTACLAFLFSEGLVTSFTVRR